MAAVNPTFVDVSYKFWGNQAVVYTWTPLANGDSGVQILGPGWADRSFQIEGTFGAAGTVLVEGSNDGVNWRTLDDPFGVPISVTTPQIRELTEITYYVRPRVSAGDGTTSITVTAILVRHGGAP